jgi:hypothetical protein
MKTVKAEPQNYNYLLSDVSWRAQRMVSLFLTTAMYVYDEYI